MSDLDALFKEMIASLQEAQQAIRRDIGHDPTNVLPLHPQEALSRLQVSLRDFRDQAETVHVMMVESGAEPTDMAAIQDLTDFFQEALGSIERRIETDRK